MSGRRGFALLETLGAALLLAVVGLVAASHASAQIELLARERSLVDAHSLAVGLEWQLRRAFSRLDKSATAVAWHYEGVHATLDLGGTGTTTYPAPLPFLSASAPRWTVFPTGTPQRDDDRADGYYREGGAAWVVRAPDGGALEPDPVAAGWDANENGIVDRPDVVAAGPASSPRRALVYALAISPPTVSGDPYAVELSIYRTMSQRTVAGAASTIEIAGVDRLVRRTLELRPGAGP